MPLPRRFLPAIVVLAACAPSGAAPRPPAPAASAAAEGGAPLRIWVHERFYPVEGTSAARINVDLASRGPSVGGRRWHAVTNFQLRWRYLPRAHAGHCSAADVALDVEIITTLPHWEDRQVATPELASAWEVYLARLREHEAGHQRIVMLEGRQLLASVERLEAPDCPSLRERARRLARGARVEVDAANKAWDETTGYGVSGG